jgi:hypothetical protein
MKTPPRSDCQCRSLSGLGLEELMIVNPSGEGEPNAFVGEDGTLYAMERGPAALAGSGELFLGDDGSVYRVERASAGDGGVGAAAGDGKEYLLGEDGRLYELEI